MNTSRFAIAFVLLCAGCDSHDIGQACPQLDVSSEGDSDEIEGRAETAEIVAQDVTFPCDDLTCIATAGRPGYCSRKCIEDAGCPAGFTCRVIQPVGFFAEQKFCAWKTCKARKDCGNVDDFCCETVPGSGAAEDLKYCAFSKDGECG